VQQRATGRFGPISCNTQRQQGTTANNSGEVRFAFSWTLTLHTRSRQTFRWASQAENAGSIPVARSRLRLQVRTISSACVSVGGGRSHPACNAQTENARPVSRTQVRVPPPALLVRRPRKQGPHTKAAPEPPRTGARQPTASGHPKPRTAAGREAERKGTLGRGGAPRRGRKA
jgi:hypothetical protein